MGGRIRGGGGGGEGGGGGGWWRWGASQDKGEFGKMEKRFGHHRSRRRSERRLGDPVGGGR